MSYLDTDSTQLLKSVATLFIKKLMNSCYINQFIDNWGCKSIQNRFWFSEYSFPTTKNICMFFTPFTPKGKFGFYQSKVCISNILSTICNIYCFLTQTSQYELTPNHWFCLLDCLNRFRYMEFTSYIIISNFLLVNLWFFHSATSSVWYETTRVTSMFTLCNRI